MSRRMHGKSFDGGRVVNPFANRRLEPLSWTEQNRRAQERKVRNIELEFSSRVHDYELRGLSREKAERLAQVVMGLFPEG